MATFTWVPPKKPPIILQSNPGPLHILARVVAIISDIRADAGTGQSLELSQTHMLLSTAKRTYKMTVLEMA